jgi:DTW domain-containing protein YfiP
MTINEAENWNEYFSTEERRCESCGMTQDDCMCYEFTLPG